MDGDLDVCIECEWHSHLAERAPTSGERDASMRDWHLHQRAEHAG